MDEFDSEDLKIEAGKMLFIIGGIVGTAALAAMVETDFRDCEVAKVFLMEGTHAQPMALCGALHQVSEEIADAMRDGLPASDQSVVTYGLKAPDYEEKDLPEEERESLKSWERQIRQALSMVMADLRGDHDDVHAHIEGISKTYEGEECAEELFGTLCGMFEVAQQLHEGMPVIVKPYDGDVEDVARAVADGIEL